MSLSNIFINSFMRAHGDMAVAGLGVAMKVNMIVVMLLIGLGTGIQPLLGYCYGAKNKKRYLAVLKFSLILALCLSIVMTVVCYVFAGPLVTAFLDNQAAYGFGFEFSRTLIISGPVLGLMFVFINAIQSTGAALPSLILSISRQGILYLPILFAMNAIFHSAKTLVLAQPITDYCAVALSAVLFFFTYKKYFKNF
jgi:Na+-driven multidrug efflux pump